MGTCEGARSIPVLLEKQRLKVEPVADMDPESQDERPETVTTGLCPEQGHRSHKEGAGQTGEGEWKGGRSCLSESRGIWLPCRSAESRDRPQGCFRTIA